MNDLHYMEVGPTVMPKAELRTETKGVGECEPVRTAPAYPRWQCTHCNGMWFDFPHVDRDKLAASIADHRFHGHTVWFTPAGGEAREMA